VVMFSIQSVHMGNSRHDTAPDHGQGESRHCGVLRLATPRRLGLELQGLELQGLELQGLGLVHRTPLVRTERTVLLLLLTVRQWLLHRGQ